jgi:hypothetical protein
MNFNKESGCVYILTNPRSNEPSLKIGRELSRQLNIDPAVVLGV